MVIRLVYTLLTGLLLAAFVGVGVATFYPGPKAPEVPEAPGGSRFPVPKDAREETTEEKEAREEYNRQTKAFEAKNKRYNFHVSLIALTATIVIIFVGLNFLTRLKEISDGILLGGVLTLAYSIIRGMESDRGVYGFILIAISLVLAFSLGYLKFVRPQTQP